MYICACISVHRHMRKKKTESMGPSAESPGPRRVAPRSPPRRCQWSSQRLKGWSSSQRPPGLGNNRTIGAGEMVTVEEIHNDIKQINK